MPDAVPRPDLRVGPADVPDDWPAVLAALSPPVRTAFLDFTVKPALPATSRYCPKCQEDLRPGHPYRVITLLGRFGEPFVVHPNDVARVPFATSRWPVGLQCARAIGLDWTEPPDPARPV